jgi:ribonuclease HI
VAEWTEPHSATEGGVPETLWVVYCDGAWEATGVGAVAVLLSFLGIKLRYAARMHFNNESDKCTNNIVEYEATLLELRKLRAIGAQNCILRTYSKVLAGQIEKSASPGNPPSKSIWVLSEEWRIISKDSQ